jgi:hypothetical protein
MKPKKIRNSLVLAELSGFAPKPRIMGDRRTKRTKQKERREVDAELV